MSDTYDHESPTGPAANGGRSSQGVGGNAIAAGFGLAAILWSLAGTAVTVLGVTALLWGGTNDAHTRCLKYRLGSHALIDQFACAVEH